MAIYSCSHSTVGRTTHTAGTAGAHARYVTRESAAREVVGEHVPLEREAARTWFDDQEAGDRKNARVIDKVMIALPIELDAAERVQLVRDFAAEIGKGRVPWLAGVHDQGKDAGNPHAHVIFRDHDHETGKRVFGMSEKGSTDRIREIWERVANQALERAGHDARIDRRSLEAQGSDRQAGIHVGPNVLAMEERGVRPVSRPALAIDGRVINWPTIDQGRTRLDRQAEIEAANDNREREKEGKGKSEGSTMPAGPPAPTGEAPAAAEPEKRSEKPTPIAQDVALPQAHSILADNPPEAPQRSSQEAGGAFSDRRDTPAPEVSRLRLAIDRARERLDALSTRLDAAFNRIKERLLDQDRQGGDQEKASRPKHLDAWRKRETPAATGSGQLRRTIDLWRRDKEPDRSGPER